MTKLTDLLREARAAQAAPISTRVAEQMLVYNRLVAALSVVAMRDDVLLSARERLRDAVKDFKAAVWKANSELGIQDERRMTVRSVQIALNRINDILEELERTMGDVK